MGSIMDTLRDIEDRTHPPAGQDLEFSLGGLYASVHELGRRLGRTVETRHIAAALKRVEREGGPVTLAAFLDRIEQEADKKKG